MNKKTLPKYLSEEQEVELVKEVATSNYRATSDRYIDFSRGRLYEIIKRHRTLYESLVKTKTKKGVATEKLPPETKQKIDPKKIEDVIIILPQIENINTPPQQKIKNNNSAMSELVAHKVASDHLTAMLATSKQDTTKNVVEEEEFETNEPNKANTDETIIISNATTKSNLGMQIASPSIYEFNQHIYPGQILSDSKGTPWTIIGWLDGRERGNGCLNLTIATKKHAVILTDMWQSKGLTKENFYFKKLEPEFYKGTPAYGNESQQFGEEIRNAKDELVGYYMIPTSKIFPKHYPITATPFA